MTWKQLIGSVCLVVVIIQKYQIHSLDFNRNTTAIWFDPYVSVTDIDSNFDLYDEDDLEILIGKITPKFSKIIINDCTEKPSPDYSIKKIPAAVAKYNWNVNKLGKSPVELTMTIGGDIDSGFERLEQTFHIADNANKLFPDTVTSIFYEFHRSSTLKSDELLKMTKSIYEKCRQAQFSYKIGVIVPLYECDPSIDNLKLFFQPLLPYLDSIWFMRERREFLSKDFDQAIQTTLRRFEVCSKKMNSFNGNFHIGFLSGWSSFDMSGGENVAEMEAYWKRLVNWSVSSNTTVAFFEAFDNPYKTVALAKHMGWWRLETDGPKVSDFIFIEKVATLKNTTEENNDGTCHSTGFFFIFFGIIVVVIGILSLGVAFAIRRFKPSTANWRGLSNVEHTQF